MRLSPTWIHEATCFSPPARQTLGESNSFDAWHIRTAEVHGLDYFLTMDFKLLRAIEGRATREPLASLKTKIVTPLQLGAFYDLMSIPPPLYSYHNASFKVRTDLNWPNGKRNPPKKTTRAQRTRAPSLAGNAPDKT